MPSMRISLTPPQRFTIVSLLLITAMVIATSFAESSFYRQAIMDREAAITYDLVNALTLAQKLEGVLAASDLKNYPDTNSKSHFERSFRTLRQLSGVARIKVFNTDQTIVWSDEPSLIGTNYTRNRNDLLRAIGGEVRTVFNPSSLQYDPTEALPQSDLIEFYVPFSLEEQNFPTHSVAGVLSLYRYPKEINDTVRQGLSLLWIVAGLAGLILYLSLFGLFRSVYFSQRRAESQFAKLSSEHEHIIQIEKLSGMGQMVSEIAHQLNNPLVGVINLTELAERDVGDTQRVKELLGEVRRAGNHCRDFVQRMLQVSKVARCEPQPTDMNQLMRDTIAFCEQSLGSKSALLLRLPSESVMLDIDPTLIRNALFNLIHNAAQADSNGPIMVSLEPSKQGGASGYEITVSDHGPGFTPETMEKLFTPFFTTRSGGTGLGLSIAQHIAMMHGGKIVAENRPEGGARLAVWLPTEKRTYETANSAR